VLSNVVLSLVLVANEVVVGVIGFIDIRIGLVTLKFYQ
jgi:hypothetical protein